MFIIKLNSVSTFVLLSCSIVICMGEDYNYNDSTNKKDDHELGSTPMPTEEITKPNYEVENVEIHERSTGRSEKIPDVDYEGQLNSKREWMDKVVKEDEVNIDEGEKPAKYHETELRVVEIENLPETVVTNVEDDDETDMVVEDIRLEEEKRDHDHVEEGPMNQNQDDRPNIILIMTDDQDIELGSMDYMPETLKIFKENGAEFRHGYVTTPMCCPSRSSLLTGLYVHNHEVYTNNDNCSSVLWREKYEKKTFAAHLWSSGYYTSYIGKYLNKYDGSHIPYGWDEWNGLLMNSRFYNYTVNRNGRRFRHGNDYQQDYYPDLIANDTLEFLSWIGNDNKKRPFLLVSSFPSPHGPEDSAPQYSEMFFNSTPHHTPSYNYAPNLDKQWILRRTDPMTPILKEFTNLLMTKRLQTLQSVDVAVKAIFDKLKSTGLSENTYVFYTSDHGYHVGQFGLVKGKSMPYEFDIRVPFFLNGPKSVVKPGTKILEPVLNIDLAPTFLELANVPVPSEMDGRSMVPLIKRYSPGYKGMSNSFIWKDVFLIESSGRREVPHEVTASPVVSTKKSKKNREERRKFFFEDNETTRMNSLCLLHPHPCNPGQKKYCRKEKDRVQFRKCRHFDFIGNGYSSVFSNDPLYQIVSNNSTSDQNQQSLKKCRCRFRRSTDDDLQTDLFDWEMERRKIDDEIEALKKRIESLRHRRKEMRRKWLLEQNENIAVKERKGKQRTHLEDLGNEGKKGDDYADFGESFGNATEHERRNNEDEDVDGERHEFHQSGETDDEAEEAEEELEEAEEEHDHRHPEVTTEAQPKIITTDTESSPNKVKNNVEEGEDTTKLSSPLDVTAYEEFPKHGNPAKEEELGLDFEGNFDIVLKPHNKHRNKNRSKDRNKPKLPDVPAETDDEDSKCDCMNDPRWIRQREREERKRKKLLSKLRKKQKYMKRIEDPEIRKQAETCGTEEKMNCFWHDNDHWKTAPFWDNGSFCFCMNSNNNTYSCLRSVNATHNYLYCQFVTGFKMYFNLRDDPYQLKNAIGTLPAAEEDWMLVQLMRLKKCKGRDECWSEQENDEESIQSSIWEQIFGRWPRKKKRGNRKRHH